MKILDDTDQPSERFSKFVSALDLDQFNALANSAALDIAQCAEPEAGWCDSNFLLNDPRVFSVYAREFLTLYEDEPWCYPIVDSFLMSGLDSKNPAHWFLLMGWLCWSVYPSEQRVERTWTSYRYCRLLQAEYDFRQHKPKKQHSDLQASKYICERKIFKDGDELQSSEALRRALPDARDPNKNVILSNLVDDTLHLIKQDYERSGLVWPPTCNEAALIRFGEMKGIQASDILELSEFDGVHHQSICKSIENINIMFEEIQILRRQHHDKLVKALSEHAFGNEQLLRLSGGAVVRQCCAQSEAERYQHLHRIYKIAR
jgi:hypothetical protein